MSWHSSNRPSCPVSQAFSLRTLSIAGEDFGPLRPDSVRYFITAVKQAAGENE